MNIERLKRMAMNAGADLDAGRTSFDDESLVRFTKAVQFDGSRATKQVAVGFSQMHFAPLDGTPVLLHMPTCGDKFVVGRWHGSPGSLHGNWGDDEGNHFLHHATGFIGLHVLEEIASGHPSAAEQKEAAAKIADLTKRLAECEGALECCGHPIEQAGNDDLGTPAGIRRMVDELTEELMDENECLKEKVKDLEDWLREQGSERDKLLTKGRIAKPAAAEELVGDLKRLIGSTVNYPHTPRSQEWVKKVFGMIDVLAAPPPTGLATQMVLYEHADGRVRVCPYGQAHFATGDPGWVRQYPVEVDLPAAPAVPEMSRLSLAQTAHTYLREGMSAWDRENTHDIIDQLAVHGIKGQS